jgi:hypothetical protein
MEMHMTEWKKQWGYMVSPTKYPGIYRMEKGGFLVRARVKDPTGIQREILKTLDLTAPQECVAWLETEKAKVRTGFQAPVSKLFSVYAADLLDRKLARGDIKSAAGERKWRTRLVHLIGGVEKGNLRAAGLGDIPVTELRASTVEAFKDQCAPMIRAGLYHPVTINGWLAILRTISKQISLEYETRDFMLGVQDFDTSLHETYTGIRYSVHLPPEVMEVLRWHVETQLTMAQERSDLLFPSETGGFRAGSALKKPFRDVVDAMGLDFSLTPRGRRRTFQDLARAAQVQDLVTRSVSGHATSEMQRHYSTVQPAEQRESLTRVLRVIQGGASPVVGEMVGAAAKVVGT